MAEMSNRPTITDPRSGGANQTFYGLTGDAARQAELNKLIFEQEQVIKSAPTTSARYREAVALRKQYIAERDGMIEEARTKATTKKKNKDLTSAQEALQRAKDLGNETEAEKAQERIDALTKEKDKPKDKTFTLGDRDGDGIPDSVDATPDAPTPKKSLTKSDTSKVPGAAVADTGKDKLPADVKSLWVSYLRSTFSSIDDKVQKAQIDNLLAKAQQQNWDEGTFIEALKGTIWWQTTLPSMRSFFLETHDPRNASTFAEKLNNQVDKVANRLEALGVSAQQRDPVTGALIDNSEYIRGIAMDSIKGNWDDNQLDNWLAEKGNIIFTGGGTLGTNLDRIKQTAFMYGTVLDANMQKEINLSLLDPNDGRDATFWVNSIKQDAINNPQFKPFQESLKQGRTLYEVTNSYRNQMATLLEVDGAAITWDDLLGKAVDGNTGNARTFADFTKTIKQDPLWQYTRNAKETYSNMALDLGKMFGFVS
jgi:hypothetical protein